MSTPSRSTQSTKTMVLAFLALTAVATAFGLGTRFGAINPGLARRGSGPPSAQCSSSRATSCRRCAR